MLLKEYNFSRRTIYP